MQQQQQPITQSTVMFQWKSENSDFSTVPQAVCLLRLLTELKGKDAIVKTGIISLR